MDLNLCRVKNYYTLASNCLSKEADESQAPILDGAEGTSASFSDALRQWTLSLCPSLGQ